MSVVIACDKHADYLDEAIESVLSQTHAQIEIVVVDDGSSDNAAQVSASHPGIHYLSQDNQGISQARNAGFRASSGEYIIFLDADDRLTPTAVEAHLRCFAEHPGAAFAVGSIECITSSGAHRNSLRYPLLQANYYEELLEANHVANTIAVMFRRALVESLGGFNTPFEPAEDYDMLLRAARSFHSVHHRAIVAGYRPRNTDISRKGARLVATLLAMDAQRPLIERNAKLETALGRGETNIACAIIWLLCLDTLLDAYFSVRFRLCAVVFILRHSIIKIGASALDALPRSV